MSAAASRLDAVAADPIIGLRGRKRKPELPFDRARQESPHAMLLPAGCVHHLLDARACGLAQQCEHALLLGDTLTPRVFSLRRRFGSGLCGLRYDGPQRFFGISRTRRGLAARWCVWLGAPLFGSSALEV